jgi:hypothetical protein
MKKIKFRVELRDVLMIGLQSIKQLEALSLYGIALNNVSLSTICFIEEKKIYIFSDLSKASIIAKT